MTKLSETDLEELYQDMEPSYMQRIKFITFGVLPGRNGEQTSGLVIMPFHMLPDSFFDQLLAKPLTGPEALTITWRKAPALGDSSKMENASDWHVRFLFLVIFLRLFSHTDFCAKWREGICFFCLYCFVWHAEFQNRFFVETKFCLKIMDLFGWISLEI